MWRNLLFAAATGALCISGTSHAQIKAATPEARRQQAQKDQQDRLQALARRGRLGAYRQLLGTGKASTVLPANADAASRDAAIDLAALGFTAADVKAYRGRQIDLFDVAHRFFEGITSPAEQMLMADTIVTATAEPTQESRNRIDGFLAEVPFRVAKSLKGSRAAGDIVRIPTNSGPMADGNYRRDFSEAQFVSGKMYLLVLSKSWYEQYVALNKKQTESGFTALPYVAYEITDGNALRRISHALRSGPDPKDIESVRVELRRLAPSDAQTRGTR